MKKKDVCLLLLLQCSISVLSLSAQPKSTDGTPAWATADLFNRHLFIENKGQFDAPEESNIGPIRWGVDDQGLQIGFSSSGISFRHEVYPILTEEEKEEQVEKYRESKSGLKRFLPEKEELPEVQLLSMHFIGANKNAVLITENPVSDYFTYPDLKYDNGYANKTIVAHAFGKLIYKNLYPLTDVEYTIGTNGKLKYVIILHPGADPSLIQMTYEGDEKLEQDIAGNIVIQTSMGTFSDQAPSSYYKNGGSVSSSFTVHNNTVGFHLGNFDRTQTVLIDPWVTVPTFSSSPNNAYNVDYDNQGNIYVYGGAAPFQLIQLNSAGTIRWTYTTSSFSIFSPVSYGHFTVDRAAGRTYIGEGYNASGAHALKISPTGQQLASFSGNSNMNEMWRLAYNPCIKQMVIGGGGPYVTTQACMLDTNLANTNPINVMGASEGEHDITLLAIDDYGNAYMATNIPLDTTKSQAYNNMMIKVPIPALLPRTWSVTDGHNFHEDTQTSYVAANTTGYNGMAVSPNFLYTYDGGTLKKWNMGSGTLISSITVGSDPKFKWAGISADHCDNVYVGYQTSIKLYDSNLNLVSTTAATDTVYDVKITPANTLCVSGKNFVQSFQFAGSVCNPLQITSTTAPSACGGSNGTATVHVTGGGTPYVYSWNTTPVQTTQTATGLSPGTYIVTVKDASCLQNVITDTLTVISTAGPTLTLSSTNSNCGNPTGTATANPLGGTAPYTYSWSCTPVQTSQTAINLSAGTYTCAIHDASGCVTTSTVTIGTTSGPAMTTSSAASSCGNSNGTATSNPTGGTAPYTYSWNTTPSQTSQTATGLSAGLYTVSVLDAAGCLTLDTIRVRNIPGPSLTVSSTRTGCTAPSGTVTANPSGGTGPYTYSWHTTPAQTTQTATNLPIGSYTVTVTDATGCSSIDSIPVTTIPGPALTVSSTPTGCTTAIGTATANPLGGTSPYTYAWQTNPVQTTATASNLLAGPYIITVTDANGCSITKTDTVGQTGATPKGTPTILDPPCSNDKGSVSVAPFGGTAPYTFSWNTIPSQTTATASNLVAGTYTLTLTDANGCTGTVVSTIKTPPPVTLSTSTRPAIICPRAAATLLASAGGGTPGYTYNWLPGGQSGDSIIVHPSVTTQYVVTVTDSHGCANTDSITVMVSPVPVVTFHADTSACKELCTQFINISTGGSTYLWHFGDGDTSHQQAPKHCYTIAGNYSVSLLVTNAAGCSQLLLLNNYIHVYPMPRAAFVPNPTSTDILHPSICFNNTSTNAATWNWTFGDSANSTSTAFNPCFTYQSTGKFCAELYVQSIHGCRDSTEQCVDILPISTLYVPNAFTPNDNGLNDLFFAQGTNIDPSHFQMWVFDRWGNLIWQTSEWGQGWDGRANGGKMIAQEDVYVWKIECLDLEGQRYNLIGHVSLIR
jgi:gliding motility-associated-like protein